MSNVAGNVSRIVTCGSGDTPVHLILVLVAREAAVFEPPCVARHAACVVTGEDRNSCVEYGVSLLKTMLVYVRSLNSYVASKIAKLAYSVKHWLPIQGMLV